MVVLFIAALLLLCLVHGLSSIILTSVPDVILAFFIGGAIMAAIIFVVLDLGFNAWHF